MDKIRLSFDGCYNYKKLKKEGLVSEEEEVKETSESDFIKMHTELNNDAC
tara:strand:- start:662 stop:811 length:150 start_codon:yes stop_codon:yes gene_type:complete